MLIMGPLIWLDAFEVEGTFSLLFSEYLVCVLEGEVLEP